MCLTELYMMLRKRKREREAAAAAAARGLPYPPPAYGTGSRSTASKGYDSGYGSAGASGATRSHAGTMMSPTGSFVQHQPGLTPGMGRPAPSPGREHPGGKGYPPEQYGFPTAGGGAGGKVPLSAPPQSKASPQGQKGQGGMAAAYGNMPLVDSAHQAAMR